MSEQVAQNTAERLRPLRLKRREERRLRAGHLWVYSNEIDTDSTPLRLFEPGDLVSIRGSNGRFLASGYVNPHSLIAARVLSRDAEHPPGRALLRERIARALALRERISDSDACRLVFGESDLLPGLIVDRYGEVLVAQTTTAGMERMQDDIIAVLEELLSPAGVLWHNSAGVRELEGLERYTRIATGDVPESVVINEDGAAFEVPLATGQKTGWYFDQRLNHARFAHYARGSAVLDVCSYVGGFGIHAALHGATEVTCVDSSSQALRFAARNAALNGVEVATVRAEALDAMRELRGDGRRFGAVVVDPPAFVKRRKDLDSGRQAYRRWLQAAMSVLEDDAILLACSCSFHMSESDLLVAVQKAAQHLGRFAQLLETGGQAPDHPVHPAIPETRYLKALFCRVTA